MGKNTNFLNMTIYKIIKDYPFTFGVFISNGFEILSQKEFIQNASCFLRLETALKIRKINQKVFIGLLEEKIENERIEKTLAAESSPIVINDPDGSLNLVAQLPRPLRVMFQQALKRFAQKWADTNGKKFNYYTEFIQDRHCPFQEYIHYNDFEKMPAMILTYGFRVFSDQDLDSLLIREYILQQFGIKAKTLYLLSG